MIDEGGLCLLKKWVERGVFFLDVIVCFGVMGKRAGGAFVGFALFCLRGAIFP